MRASELIERLPTVTRRTSALEAARLVAEYRLASLVVADDDGVPVAVVPAINLLRPVIPKYVRDDPSLAHVYDEAGAQEMCSRLGEATVADLLDDPEVTEQDLPTVQPQDTLVEVAMAMLESHSPVIVVRDKANHYHGTVSFSRAMAAIAAAAGGATPGLQRRLQDDLLGQDDAASTRARPQEPSE